MRGEYRIQNTEKYAHEGHEVAGITRLANIRGDSRLDRSEGNARRSVPPFSVAKRSPPSLNQFIPIIAYPKVLLAAQLNHFLYLGDTRRAVSLELMLPDPDNVPTHLPESSEILPITSSIGLNLLFPE